MGEALPLPTRLRGQPLLLLLNYPIFVLGRYLPEVPVFHVVDYPVEPDHGRVQYSSGENNLHSFKRRFLAGL